MDIDKLELSIETLRDLNDDELRHVAGGAPPTYWCPHGPPTQPVGLTSCSPVITNGCFT